MIWFVLKRILLFVPVTLGVLFIVFTINNFTPSDPVYSILGLNISQEQYDAKYEELRLGDPFFTRFFNYILGIVTRFDLGDSFSNKRPVAPQIVERLPTTLRLGLTGLSITVIIGIPIGIISAVRQYSILDNSVTSVSLFLASMPNFWLGLMLILIFSLRLKWLPATGIMTWRHWILPSLTLGLGPVATVVRMTRSSMLDVIRQDYIRSANAKGLTEMETIWSHAIRNALIPVITAVGFMASMIMGGAVVIEAVFAIPGVGGLLMSAISNADYPLIMGSVFFVSVSVCIINLLVDLIYAAIDPRIKAQYQARKKRVRKTAMTGGLIGIWLNTLK